MFRLIHRVGLAVVLVTILGVSVVPAIPIPPNVPVTGALPGLQNEEQIWICPIDTNIVVTNHRDFRLGYRQIGLGRSVNGGQTWVDTLIKPAYQIFGWQSDPVMTVNRAGEYFISHLDYDPSGADGLSWTVFLKSTDKGATWTGPYRVEHALGPYFEDKQFVTCDRTGGSHDGNVYISWTRFSGGEPTRMMFCRSIGGSMGFGDTIIVGRPLPTTCFGTLSSGQFSQPLVGKDGAVYVFWLGFDVDSSAGCTGFEALRMNKSTDGGATWQNERVVRRVDGWNSVAGGINVYSEPVTDADISGGPHAGNLYLQYRDTASAPLNFDIMFQRSLDTGHTWSPPVRVNDDPTGTGANQFHNWMVCNEQGILASIWYDQRTDPAFTKFDVFAAYSYDGGATWTANNRISSVSIDPAHLAVVQSLAQSEDRAPAPASAGLPGGALSPLSPQAGAIGEYIGLSCVGDKVVAVWTDTRAGTSDVYSANWYLPLTDPRLIYPLNGETVSVMAPGLTWATAWKESEDKYRLQIASSPTFTTVLRDVFVTTNTYNDSLLPLTGGLYYWRIKAYRAPGGVPADSTGFSAPGSFRFTGPFCSCPHQGDINSDGVIDVFDVIDVIGIAFSGGPDPKDPSCPRTRGDADNNGVTDVFDVIYLIATAFSGGPVPVDPCGP